MKDRREYRSIYVDITDDPEFQATSVTTKGVFYTLKMRLPAIGIGKMTATVLAAYANCTADVVEAAALELAPWVRRAGNVWWIVNGLRFNPALSEVNPLHRTFVRKQLEALAKSALVAAFHAHYPEWFGAAPSIEGGSDTLSIGTREGIESQETRDERQETGDGKQETSTPPPSPARVRETGVVGESELAALLPTEPDRLALTAVCASVPRPSTWLAEMRAALDGMHGVQVTPTQLGEALRDYVANGAIDARASLTHFRAYLHRAARAARAGPRDTGPPSRARPPARPATSPPSPYTAAISSSALDDD